MSSGVELLVFPIGLLAVAGARAAGRMADAAAERRQRRIEARARADRALVDHEILRSRVEQASQRYGPAITPMPEIDRRGLDSTDAAVAGAALRRLSEQLAATHVRFQQETAAASTATLLAQLDAATAIAGAPPVVGPPAADPDSPARTVRRVLERLDPTVAADARRRLESRAADALSAPAGRAAALVDDLRDEVRRANEALTVRRARLADLHDRLARHAPHAAYAGGADPLDEARRVLLAAADDPDPDWPGLTTAVETAVDRTVAAALRAYAAEAVRDALEEVGCEVEAGFDVLLVENGTAHLRRPEWDDLAVRVRRTDAADGQALRFSLVAPSDSASPLDAETEQKWCGKVDELQAALAARGVGADLVERTPIGAAYVQPVARSRFPFGSDAEGEAGTPARRRVPERVERRREIRP